MFEVDLARVIDIAVIRVQMFDAGNGTFGSKESGELFREYRTIRQKYDNDPRSDIIRNSHSYVWDYYPDI